MSLFIKEVNKVVERRIKELQMDITPLPVDGMASRYERRDLSHAALHFELQLDGIACVLSITVLDQQQVDDYQMVSAVSDEVGRLQKLGRFVLFHQVMVAPKGAILVDLVGPVRDTIQSPFEASATRFLNELFNHDVVRKML